MPLSASWPTRADGHLSDRIRRIEVTRDGTPVSIRGGLRDSVLLNSCNMLLQSLVPDQMRGDAELLHDVISRRGAARQPHPPAPRPMPSV